MIAAIKRYRELTGVGLAEAQAGRRAHRDSASAPHLKVLKDRRRCEGRPPTLDR